MTFALTLPADHPRQPKPAGTIGPDPDHTDFELMIRLFHGGPQCRDAALDMADINRRKAQK